MSQLDSLRRILPLAWPVLVGQVALLAYSTIDTILLARYSADDLAALAVGSAIYITLFVGLMGVMMAVAPMVGRHHGAGRYQEAGEQLHQTTWLAFALMLPGILLLLHPDLLLKVSMASPAVEIKVRGYLSALACSLPPALLFTAFRGFNNAVSRPKAVMILQVGSLVLKLPLSLLLIHGLPDSGLPAMGAVGCGMATAIVMWTQTLIAFALLRSDKFYVRYGLHRGGLHRPDWLKLKALLKLGLPMGASILIEISGFTFMAIFIARLGSTAVAGHQLATNLVTLMFMLPMALGNATSTLVAQRLGANDRAGATRIGWHGLELAMALSCGIGALMFFGRAQVLALYTDDAAIIASAMPLLLWVWVFHVADASQTLAAYVLRAHHIATLPMVINALALWGVGLGLGYWMAFGHVDWAPASLQGAPGFWSAATAGLVIAAIGLCSLLAWVHRRERG